MDDDVAVTLQLDEDGTWLATANDSDGSPNYDASGDTPLAAVTRLAVALARDALGADPLDLPSSQVASAR